MMIISLPQELLNDIFVFLQIKDLFSFSVSCKLLYCDGEIYIRKKNQLIIEKNYPTLLRDPYYIEPKSPFLHHYELCKDRIIVVRGFLTYSMNVQTGKWKRCHDSRRDRGYFASVYYRGEIYAIGTYSLVAAGTVEKYSPFTDFWHMVSPLPMKLRSVGAAVFQDQLYILGGIESFTDIVTSKIYVFDYEKDEANVAKNVTTDSSCWTDINLSLLRPRYRHAAVTYNGKIWIAGGTFENFEITNTVEIFDPELGIVLQGPSMLARRDFANLLIVKDGLYAVGGDVDLTGNPIIRTIEKYNEQLHEWTYVASFKDTRRGFSTCAYQSKIYVFCGSNDTKS